MMGESNDRIQQCRGNHQRLKRMLFKALNRVTQLNLDRGLDAIGSVFDRELVEFYEQYLAECDPEERKEWECHDRVSAAFRKYQADDSTRGN